MIKLKGNMLLDFKTNFNTIMAKTEEEWTSRSVEYSRNIKNRPIQVIELF